MKQDAGPAAENSLRAFARAISQEAGGLNAAKEEWSARLLIPAARKAARPQRAVTLTRRAPVAISPAPEHNVVGIGVGEKLVNGEHTGTLAVKFLVKIKYRESDIEGRHRLPKSIEGLPVDVDEAGIFRAFTAAAARASARPVAVAMPNPRTRIRPAQPGCSVGFRFPGDQFVMAGTFGAVVTDGTDRFILSNNHVLADENRLALGSPIFQPGLLDGGKVSTDQVAELTRFVPVQASAFNQVDCAIARVLRSDLVSNAILFIGPPQGTAAAQRDMVVHKFGRTTGYQAGRVTSVNTDVKIRYDMGEVAFRRQIIVEGLKGQPFSAQGDSGSLILERQSQRAIGLLFGGSPSHTIANHIEDVLQALNVTLA
jgi:S1-C subfamily serine protease